MSKLAVNPVTGCAHIRNEKVGDKIYRVCSACGAEVLFEGRHKRIEEKSLRYCYACGELFDHTDDEEKEIEEWSTYDMGAMQELCQGVISDDGPGTD